MTIQKIKIVDGIQVALLDFPENIFRHVVAWNFNSTKKDWGQGYYYEDLKTALKKYNSY